LRTSLAIADRGSRATIWLFYLTSPVYEAPFAYVVHAHVSPFMCQEFKYSQHADDKYSYPDTTKYLSFYKQLAMQISRYKLNRIRNSQLSKYVKKQYSSFSEA